MLLAGVALLTGCPTPNMYTTPRTLPPGEVQQTFSADTWGRNVPRGQRGSSDPVVLPTIPTYTIRLGVAERAELGIRLAQGGTLPGAEMKLQLVRGSVDLAILPRIEATLDPFTNRKDSLQGLVYLYAPMLLGLNVSENLTLVTGGGLLYGGGGIDRSSSSTDKQASYFAPVGGMASFTFGVDVRTGKGFAVHPEISVLRHLKDDAILTMAGVGFTFGHAVSYADVR